MTTRPLLAALSTSLAAVAASVGSLEASDWPQWGGRDGRNMVSEATGLPADFVPGKKQPSGGGIDLATAANVRWAVRLGSHTYGNPTVSRGRIFVGTDDSALRDDDRLKSTKGGMVQCLEETTGRTLWKLVTPSRDELPKDVHFTHQWLGTCSSPAVDGDRVYVVSSACEVLCLDAEGLRNGNEGPFLDEAGYMAPGADPPIAPRESDADIIWRLDLIREAGVAPHDAASCSPLVHGDIVYVATSNGVDEPHARMVAPEAPAFVGLDKRTGRVVATDGEKLSARLWHAQWSSPSLGKVSGRTLILLGGGDGFCYAFEALDRVPERPVELRTVWRFDCNPPGYRLRDGKPIPYYDGDVRKKKGNKNDGQYVGPSEILATPVFHDGRVYVAIGQDPAHGRGKGLLHAIDASGEGDITTTGRLWSYDGLDRTISTVAVAGGLVYCADIAGRLHCVDAATGAPVWVHDTGSETWSSPLVADGKVYLATKGPLFVLAHGREERLLAEIDLGAPSYASPIVANGVLLVASQRYLWAVAETDRGSER